MGEVKPPLIFRVARSRRRMTIFFSGNILVVGTDMTDDEIMGAYERGDVLRLTDDAGRTSFINLERANNVLAEDEVNVTVSVEQMLKGMNL